MAARTFAMTKPGNSNPRAGKLQLKNCRENRFEKRCREIAVSRKTQINSLVLLAALIIGFGSKAEATNCPLCPAIGAQTIGEELSKMDITVFAKLTKLGTDVDPEDPVATFEVLDVIKGAELLGSKKTFTITYYGSSEVGTEFLISAIDPLNLTWSLPVRITDRTKAYIREVTELKGSPVERLEFYLDRLEDPDEVIASDAYDEFARAPYDEVVSLKPKYDRAQLVEWIQSDEVPLTRRRLYFMLLGICGDESEAPMLEKMIREGEHPANSGLDSMVACYLSLAGNDGLELINERFLANKKSTYSQVYSVIMALRFHGTDGNKLDKEEIVKSFRLLLDRPSFADLVIPDLARWKDWESMERLAKLFKETPASESFVRVPIVIYMQLCPREEAKSILKELKEIDPNAFKKAEATFPFGG